MPNNKDDGTWEVTLPEVTVRLFVRGGRVVFIETYADGKSLRGWPWGWMATEQRSFRWCRMAISIGLRGRKPAGLFSMRRVDPPAKPRHHTSGRTLPLPRLKKGLRKVKRPPMLLPEIGVRPLKPPPLGFTEDTPIGGAQQPPPPEA